MQINWNDNSWFCERETELHYRLIYIDSDILNRLDKTLIIMFNYLKWFQFVYIWTLESLMRPIDMIEIDIVRWIRQRKLSLIENVDSLCVAQFEGEWNQ